MEKRTYKQTELRVDNTDNIQKIQGLIPYYNGTRETEYELLPNVFERIMPGAFKNALNGNEDVVSLINHDDNLVLGRVSAGTLTLTDSPEGLRYEVIPGDTSYTKDLIVSIQRGDIKGSSFQFVVTEDDLIEDGERLIRAIYNVDLMEIGVVTFPAYEGSTAGYRSVDGVDDLNKRVESYKNTKREQERNKRARDIRARIVELDL